MWMNQLSKYAAICDQEVESSWCDDDFNSAYLSVFHRSTHINKTSHSSTMLSSISSYLFGSSSPEAETKHDQKEQQQQQQQEEAETCTCTSHDGPCKHQLKTRATDDEWVLVDKSSEFGSLKTWRHKNSCKQLNNTEKVKLSHHSLQYRTIAALLWVFPCICNFDVQLKCI